MASVREIAKRAGVSAATVSRALNHSPAVSQATRDRVLAAMRGVNYTPTVGTRITTVVGLVYPSAPVIPTYGGFESALLVGILRGLNEHRFDLKLVSVERDKSPDETYTQFFMRKGLRGALVRTFESTRWLTERIAAEQFPHVTLAERPDDPSANYIWADSRGPFREAVSHLIILGHRRIALVVNHVRDADHADRVASYREALDQAHIPYDPDLHLEVLADINGGRSALTRLLGLPDPPTAVCFTDPEATIGGVSRCRELGVAVPDELSIVGFDDSDIRTHLHPRVSAVCQDATRLGFEAATWLTRRLVDSDELPLRKTLPTTFEVNASTAPPPQTPVRCHPDGTRAESWL